MITKLAGGRSTIRSTASTARCMDLWIEDGRIVAPPADGQAGRGGRPRRQGRHARRHRPAQPYRRRQGQHRADDAAGGAPRPSSSTATARCRSGSGHYSPSTFTTGYAYARMGYTMAFEPAMLPVNARQAHQEMADVPLLDKGAYVLLGNDDLFLRLVKDGAGAGRDPRLCRLDPARDPGAGGQDRQSRRHQRLQVQRPQARPRRGRPVLRHHAAHRS